MWNAAISKYHASGHTQLALQDQQVSLCLPYELTLKSSTTYSMGGGKRITTLSESECLRSINLADKELTQINNN